MAMKPGNKYTVTVQSISSQSMRFLIPATGGGYEILKLIVTLGLLDYTIGRLHLVPVFRTNAFLRR
jgi:hypothetical protein